jgi:nitrite reductase (NADH) large subunit
VIGGGLLGLEAANGLRARGMEVTVVHLMPWLMERQLDETAAGLLQATLQARGIAFRLGAQTVALVDDGNGNVGAARLMDGAELPADLVVMAAGIRPNIDLAQAAGLHCERGIVVSDTLQSYDPRIYAVGECVAHRGVAYGLVAPLYEMAKVCATHLAGLGIGRYAGTIPSTRLKVTGVDLFSAGDFMGGVGTEAVTLCDPEAGIYRKIVLRNERVAGAVFYGDTSNAGWTLDLMRGKRDVTPFRDALAFGPEAVAGLVPEAGPSVAPLPAATGAAERRVA